MSDHFELVKYGDGNCRRIQDRSGNIRGFIIKLANGRWRATDQNDRAVWGTESKTDRASFNKWCGLHEGVAL